MLGRDYVEIVGVLESAFAAYIKEAEKLALEGFSNMRKLFKFYEL